MLDKVKPLKIRTNGGSEFYNSWFNFVISKNIHIYQLVTLNEVKANNVERLSTYVKTMIYR